ncbi:MAG: acylphosphatase [Firmicutes bacterium]|nr:acylphosphatase [Bacillota bacterium]MCL5014844.1 acylphosphatase [Bacillota bacterium]
MVRKRLRLEIVGRVQGVGFRQSTWDVAQRYGITGWVHNTEDRRCVRVEAEGEDEQLIRFLEWIRHGPPLARIDHISQQEVPVQRDQDFEIRQ